MVVSVNTNSPAAGGLQQLSKTNSLLQKREERISTGLKVNGPKDNAAIFAISRVLQGDISGAGAVKTALSSGESTVSVAISAGTEVSNLLTDLKGIAVQASQDGLDPASRQSLQNEFNALKDQISTVVGSASFNGINLITSGGQNFQVLSGADGSTISVQAQDLSLTGLGVDTLSVDSAANALTAVNSLTTAIDQAGQGLAKLGSSATQIEKQSDFTTSLQNIQREGLGNLVDANLAEESAGVSATRVKQQLGLTALSIANAGPSAILALFR